MKDNMKKYIIGITTGLVLVFTASSCFDLSETVYSEIPVNSFFKTEKDIIAYAGRAYVGLQPYPEEQRLWSLTENASDELVIPEKYNGEWYEQGRWEDMQKHKLVPNNKILTKAWEMVLPVSQLVMKFWRPRAIDFEGKERVLAEIKILRAYYYYWALDNWGNIPFTLLILVTQQLPEQKNRQFVYDFIVQEILDNIDLIQDVPTPEYYGRVTKGMAYTFLAKMYINAEEWIGQINMQMLP
jgi:hypothetical protein